MKTKLEMAHEYAIALINSDCEMQFDKFIQLCWNYADAMQVEADKRGEEEIDKWSDELSNILKLSKFKPLELQPDSKEWQPDWSQAPEWANWWAMDENRDCYWHSCVDSPFIGNGVFEVGDSKGHTYDAPLFGYQGDWRDSLRKRPQ